MPRSIHLLTVDGSTCSNRLMSWVVYRLSVVPDGNNSSLGCPDPVLMEFNTYLETEVTSILRSTLFIRTPHQTYHVFPPTTGLQAQLDQLPGGAMASAVVSHEVRLVPDLG